MSSSKFCDNWEQSLYCLIHTRDISDCVSSIHFFITRDISDCVCLQYGKTGKTRPLLTKTNEKHTKISLCDVLTSIYNIHLAAKHFSDILLIHVQINYRTNLIKLLNHYFCWIFEFFGLNHEILIIPNMTLHTAKPLKSFYFNISFA